MQDRHKPRSQLTSYLDVIDPISAQIMGYLGDVSKEGMMILTEQAVSLHDVHELALRMPQQASFHKQWVTVKAEVRWIRENAFNPHLRRVGFRFLHVAPEDVPLLEILAHSLAQNG